MKYLAAVMAVFMMVGVAFAKDSVNTGLRIVSINGTVNMMKDGLVIMTLKKGDAIPQITDPSITFVVIDGNMELEASGQKVSAATGSNFTITSSKGQVSVVTTAGSPVQIVTASGNSIVVTQNSEVKIETSKGKMEVSVAKGSAVVSNPSGGESKTINAGEKAEVAVVAPAAPVAAQTEKPAPNAELQPSDEPVTIQPLGFMDLTSSVIPTKEVQESNEVSPSTPQ